MALLIKRGTRSALDTAAANSLLNQAELYLITDEGRLAVGLSATTYQTFAFESSSPAIPVNTAAPVLSGSTVVGSELSVTTGTWTGFPSPAYSYQWYSDDVAITGATSNTFTTTSTEAETEVYVEVTGTNSEGSASADSNSLTIDAVVPVGTYAPTVVMSGTGLDDGVHVFNTTGCDAFIAVISAQSSNSPTLTDSQGGTWTEIANWTGTGGGYTNRTRMFLCQNVLGTASHSFDPSAAGAGVLTIIGLDKSGGVISIDQTAVAKTGGTSPYVTNSVTPTVPESLAVAAWNPINFSADGSTATYGLPFVGRGGSMDGTWWTSVAATADLTSATTLTATMTNAVNPSNGSGSMLLNMYCEA